MDATPSPRRKPAPAELVAAVLIVAWRAWAVGPAGLRHDWPALLAAFWIAVVLSEGTKARRWITLGAMILLLVIYLFGQIPATTAFLRATL